MSFEIPAEQPETNQKKSDAAHILYHDSSRTALEELRRLEYDEIDRELRFRGGKKSFEPEYLWELGFADNPEPEHAGLSQAGQELLETYHEYTEKLDRKRVMKPVTHLGGVWALELAEEDHTAYKAARKTDPEGIELGITPTRIQQYETALQNLGALENSHQPLQRNRTEQGELLLQFLQEIEEALDTP